MDLVTFAIGALGIAAGMVTTIAGFGGGLLLVVMLAATLDPLTALALTSLALLVGNTHRVGMLKHAIETRVVAPYLAGALPGAIIGAAVAVSLPIWLIHALIVGAVAFAFGRTLGWFHYAPGRRALVPAGALVGVVTATSGGGGLLQGPTFLAYGLSGDAFVATMSTCAVFIHIGRIGGYAYGGLISGHLLVQAGLLAITIVAGNLLGRRISSRLPSGARRGIELGTLTLCTLVGVLGLVR